MSHELRTPLNSLLILAEQLEDNPDHNMTDTQVQYASVIRASGKDLLGLLNSILDLAKVESGTVTVELAELSVAELRAALLREFEHVAEGKGPRLLDRRRPGTPEHIVTDPQRLRQILKNLLANAFKFTEHGEVHVRSAWPPRAGAAETESLATRPRSSPSSVTRHRHRHRRASSSSGSSRRSPRATAPRARLYGGTGLGLSISRELVGLLGGEIALASTPGQGSTFTVYLPLGDGRPPPTTARSRRHRRRPPRCRGSQRSTLRPDAGQPEVGPLNRRDASADDPLWPGRRSWSSTTTSATSSP